MTKYELVVIFDPYLEEGYDEQTERVKELITRNGGEVTHVDPWGRKRLAYEIDRKAEGHYVLFNFEGEMTASAIAEIERGLRLNELVLREMVTRVPAPKPEKKTKPRKPRAAQTGGEGERRSYPEPRSAGDAGNAALTEPGPE